MLNVLQKSVVVTTLSFSLFSFTFAQKSEVVVPKINEKISRAAFLRDKLPENTVFYARFPSQFGMAFGHKNKASDIVMNNSANEKAVLELKAVLEDPKLVAKALEEHWGLSGKLPFVDLSALTSLIYTAVNGPIEIVGSDVNQSISPATQVLAVIPVKYKTTQELEGAVRAIIKQDLPLAFDNNFLKIDKTALLYFDTKDQRLYLSAGLKALGSNELKNAISTLKSVKEHKMYAYENQIDLSGQNFFTWADTTGSREMVAMVIGKNSPYFAEYILNTEGMAYGVGTSAGKLGQVKFISKTNTDKISWLKNTKAVPDFKTVGEPKNVVLFSLPTKENLMQLLSSNSDVSSDVEEAGKVIESEVGLNPLSVLDIFGSQVISYTDETGSNFAIGIRDKKAFNAMLDGFKKNKGVSYQVMKGVHELKIKNPLPALMAKESKGDAIEKLLTQYGMSQPLAAEFVSAFYGIRALDTNFYLYWSDEQDWIVINSLPYSLTERKKAKNSLAKWFGEQGIQSQDMLLGVQFTVKNAEERWYRDYLKFMRNNHDLLGKNFDLFSMPAPSSVKFNPISRIGFHISKNSGWVTASLDYDISPFYAFSLLGGESSSVAAVGVIGIASMFALPAYSDYTKRTYIAEGMALSAAAKMASTEVYATEGKWPADNKEAGLPSGDLITGQAVSSIEVYPEGEIMITYNDKVKSGGFVKIKGKTISDYGSVQWRCVDTNLDMKTLPVNCRTEMMSNQ